MVRVMDSILAEIESALATVQRTLDALTARGQHEAAFDIARAQYVASIRASWPQNLGALVTALEAVESDTKVQLSDDERENVRRAVRTFRKAVGQ